MNLLLKVGWDHLSLSSETKPTPDKFKLIKGHILYETDTGKIFVWAGNWKEADDDLRSIALKIKHNLFVADYYGHSSLAKPQPKRYNVKNGTGYYETDTTNFFIFYNGTWYLIPGSVLSGVKSVNGKDGDVILDARVSALEGNA